MQIHLFSRDRKNVKTDHLQKISVNISVMIDVEFPNQQTDTTTEALLGGVYAPCSLRHLTPFSLLPSILRRSLLFSNNHCSFFIFLCSLLLFNFSSCSLIISLAPCSISQFLLLPAPFSKFSCSLLPDYVFLAPCSLPYYRPCSLLPWVSRAILPAPWLPLTGVHWRRVSTPIVTSRSELGAKTAMHDAFLITRDKRKWKWVPPSHRCVPLYITLPV